MSPAAEPRVSGWMYLGFEPTTWREVSRSPVTLAWLAIITVMFALTGGTMDTEVLLRFGAADHASLWRGEAWRLLTSGMLHFGAFHFLGNAAVMPGWGARVEQEFGSARTALAIATCIVASSGLSALGEDLTSAGASGGLLGLTGITLVLEYRLAGGLLAFLERRGVLRRLFVVLALFVIGVALSGEGAALQMDNRGHVGGLAFGVLLGLVMTSKRRGLWALPAVALAVLVALPSSPQLTAYGRWQSSFDAAAAASDYSAALKLLEDPPGEVQREWVKLQVAWARIGLGQYEEALEAVDSVMPPGPRPSLGASGFGGGAGTTLAAKRRRDRLRKLWSPEPDPWELDARRFRSLALHNLGRNDEALVEINLALASNESDAWLRYGRAIIYNDTQRHAEALQDLEVAFLTAQEVDFYEARIQARLALEDFEGALADVAEAEKASMAPMRCALLRGWAEFSRADYQAALAHFQTALQLDAEEPFALLGRCQALQSLLADPYEIIAACSLAIEAHPRSANAYTARGDGRRWRSDEGDLDLAALDYDQALELEPTQFNALLGRAWIASVRKESDASSRTNELLVQYPDEVQVISLAGENALAADDRSLAKKHCLRVLELAPEGSDYSNRATEVLTALEEKR